MAEIVRMPKLSDTMTEGVVAEWHKKIGDTVESGELLAEIETDKATMEFESFQDGVLLHIGCEKGATAPVESILAILGEKGEDISDLLAEDAKSAPVEEKKEEVEETPKTESKPAEVEKPVAQKVATSKPKAKNINTADGRAKVSPLAKKLAEEKGINLAFVNGTGDNGRIVKRDIDNYQGGSVGTTFVGTESYTEEPVSQMRKVIAKRLSESKFTAPHFYITSEINMDAVIDARKTINTIATTKISFNDFVLKAVASAIRKNPKVNSAWQGDTIRYNNHINIGVAMAVEDGLLVPVVRFADGKTLSQISAEVKDYAGRAAEKKLQPEDWTGNTFTVSNLGMFGVEEFTAIVNSPDACILAVGGIKQTPIVKNGQIVPGNVMKVTLSSDHRVVDGAVAAAFLKTLKQLLENPVILLGEQSI
jgi:pyruvate dehydrogenase E2 component (dihydrolipoamide acetyltransferase)